MIHLYISKDNVKHSALLKTVLYNVTSNLTIKSEDKINDHVINPSEIIVRLEEHNIQTNIVLSESLENILASTNNKIELLNKIKAAFAIILGNLINKEK